MIKINQNNINPSTAVLVSLLLIIVTAAETKENKVKADLDKGIELTKLFMHVYDRYMEL